MTHKTVGVLFVCVKNGGKSQMAGALMRHVAPDWVIVHTAGTRPGNELNAESVASLAEVGIEVGDERPKPITAELLADVSLIVTVGGEAVVDPIPGVEIRVWDVDEPSLRGVGGEKRMRLVRDDISGRVRALVAELEGSAPTA